MKNYSELLKKKFDDKDIEWRIQSCGLSKSGKPWAIIIPYLQARAVQERLDSVFGFENWEDCYRRIPNTKAWICILKVEIQGKSIYKENGADETNIESTKGGISDSFKRVASSGYGIGRYLYEEKERFAECSLQKTNEFTEKGKIKDGNKHIIFYWKIPKLNIPIKDTDREQIIKDKITREKVRRILIKVSQDNEKGATELLKVFTSFKDNDGKMINGISDFEKLKGKRLYAVYGKVSSAYKQITEKVKLEIEKELEDYKNKKYDII